MRCANFGHEKRKGVRTNLKPRQALRADGVINANELNYINYDLP